MELTNSSRASEPPKRVPRLLLLVFQPYPRRRSRPAPTRGSYTLSTFCRPRNPLEPVDFSSARYRRQVQPSHLLKVRERRNLQAVEHHLPGDSPCAQRRRFPVVFFEPDVVLARINPAGFETLKVDLLHFVGRRLENHLKLVMLEEPVRILSETAIRGPTRRLDERDVPKCLGPRTLKRVSGV